MNWESFKSRLEEMGIHLTKEQIAQFHRYFSLLREWNQRMNLTAIDNEEEVIEKHFYDSLKSAEYFHYDDQSLLDVGSGAGFPGLPLKIAFPSLFVTLLEPTTKRVTFLVEVIKQLNLKNIVVVNERAEDYAQKVRSYYDVVTARAVASLPILLELTIPFLKIDGTFVALKGAKGVIEDQESQKAKQELRVSLIHMQEWHLENGDQRINLFYKKTAENSLKYPRSYGQIKKKPL